MIGVDEAICSDARAVRDRESDAPRAFPALLDARIRHVLETQAERLSSLVARHGSPLHVVWPHAVARNVAAMRGVLRRHAVDHEMFYAAKANKSQALVRAAVDAGAGIDVSSPAEFEDAVRAGLAPSRICATGPAKTVAFHEALVDAGALIAVDSLEELVDLERSASSERRARVLLRLRPRSEAKSRFGMDHDALVHALGHLARDASPLAFEGLHVHLGSYRVETRIAAFQELVGLVDSAAAMGLATRTIDIGGGLPVRYVAPDRYEAALRAQAPGDYRTGTVPASFYPYGSEETAVDWLETFLAAPCHGTTIAAYLRDADIRLAIEPGRSLVDQAAISIFSVTRVKRLDGDTAVIFVEGSGFSACETWFGSEFLVDPILVRGSAVSGFDPPLRAYIAGHSCLDDDVITNRWLAFPAAPRPGDLLVYANTAGYQMDLLENEFHRHPMPGRLVATLSADGHPVFVHDK